MEKTQSEFNQKERRKEVMTRKQIATAKSKRDLIQTVKRIIRRHPESEAARIIVEAIYELYVEGKGVTRP